MGPKDYGVLLTDRRTVFVLERASKAILLGALGDALVTDKRTVDYSSETIDGLAGDSMNMAILNHDIERLGIRRKLGSYVLMLEHRSATGKTKTVKAYLTPPQSLVKSKTEGGMNKAQVAEEYAKAAMRAFELALPPTVVQRGELNR
ncbi:TPA: hypothetical protein HA259_00785 [Thermoplasmata archaeon]|nr:hypothetical protein [Thermoplasmata archaeon]